jgi:hypothetical protein
MSIRKLLLIFAFISSIFSSTAFSMMDDFSDTDKRQTCKNKKKCPSDCEDKVDNKSLIKREGKDKNASNRLWYDGGCCTGGCSTQVNTYPTSQGEYDEEIGRYNIFYSSFLNGAAYTLLPELIRDTLEFRGYSRVSNVVATIVQGGMIVYNTSSYAPVVVGTLVRTSFNQLGFSQQDSIAAGITASIVTSFSQKLIFSQETVLNCLVDVGIGVAGSYTGSALALKAKSWAYELFGYNKPMVRENVQ